MRRLSETIERRLAGEIGVVRKEHGGKVRVCLAYPNTYSVGMSSLGFQTIYHLLNAREDVVCERAFVPDDVTELERTGTELVSYESQTALGRFDVIAFSVSYELDYVGVARVLRLANVPPLAANRRRMDPFVIAGGAAVTLNPEPLADLVDAFVLGEGEEVIGEVVEALRSASGRAEAVEATGGVEGVWVHPTPCPPPRARRGGTAGAGGLTAGVQTNGGELRREGAEATNTPGSGLPHPLAPSPHAERGKQPDSPQSREGHGEIPSASSEQALRGAWNDRLGTCPTEQAAGMGMPALQRRYVRDLEGWPTHSRVLTEETEFGSLFLVEVSRGCGRGCKFCVTPRCYWPLRWRSAEGVVRSAREGMEHRKAIGLVGAAVSDHPEIDEIARRIVGMGARLSVSSLRADSVSDALLDCLVRSGAKSITIAPEAGSERLRREIGKGIPDEAIFDCLRRAAAAGMREAKLYFMVGLPGETEADVEAIPELVRRCAKEGDLRRVTAAAGAFVPKRMTPYEGQRMLPVRELSRRLRVIREALRKERGVRLALESANWSAIEGLLSQGGRELGEVIVKAEARGGSLGAWREAVGGMAG